MRCQSALTAPANGEVACTSGRDIGSHCTYTCSSGYRVNGGSNTRRCILSGSSAIWTGAAPNCSSKFLRYLLDRQKINKKSIIIMKYIQIFRDNESILHSCLATGAGLDRIPLFLSSHTTKVTKKVRNTLNVKVDPRRRATLLNCDNVQLIDRSRNLGLGTWHHNVLNA